MNSENNRELKFMAYIKSTKTLCKIIGFISGNTEITIWYFSLGLLIRERICKNDIIIFQYIGKKDKTSKEIYEGHLFKMNSCDVVCVVKWDSQDCRFICYNKKHRMAIAFAEIHNYKIIGHEMTHGELLK